MNFEHIAFNLPDPQAASAWYTENLGLKIVKAADTAPFVHFLADDSGSMLEFYNNPGGVVPDYASMSPFALHLAFSADDIEATWERLLGAGATAVDEIETTPTGDRIVFCVIRGASVCSWSTAVNRSKEKPTTWGEW